jgi:hypothetical protein
MQITARRAKRVARRDGGADGEVEGGRGGVARREGMGWLDGKGRARRGQREGWPNGGGAADGFGRLPDEKGGGETGLGRCQTRGGSVGWGFLGARRDGRVSEWEGRRGRLERVSEQRRRVKLAAWIMCTCGMLGPLVLHPIPHQWNRLC